MPPCWWPYGNSSVNRWSRGYCCSVCFIICAPLSSRWSSSARGRCGSTSSANGSCRKRKRSRSSASPNRSEPRSRRSRRKSRKPTSADMATSDQDDESVQPALRDPWRNRLGNVWRALSVKASPAPATSSTASAAVPLRGELIESLIGGLPQPTIVLGRDGRIIAFNAAAATIAPGLRRGEPASIALRMPDLVNAIRRAGEKHEAQRVEFFERVPLDRWFEAFVTPIRLGDDNLLVITFNDLTPLRRVEEMRADFVANASHELRTPLAALLGFVETLQGPAKDDSA